MNQGKVCVKAWNAHEFVHIPELRRIPLIRKEGRLEEKSWEEPLDVTVSRLKAIKSGHGSDGSGFLPRLDGRTRTIAINTSSVAEERMSISQVDCKG